MEKGNFFLVFVPFHSHSLSGLERCFMYVNGYQIQIPVSFLLDFTIERLKDSTMVITEVYLLHILFYKKGTIPAVKLRSPSLALFVLDFRIFVYPVDRFFAWSYILILISEHKGYAKLRDLPTQRILCFLSIRYEAQQRCHGWW